MADPRESVAVRGRPIARRRESDAAYWDRAQIWIPPNSPWNASRRCAVAVLSLYNDRVAHPPPFEVIEQMIDGLRPIVPWPERDEFAIQAAILRATASEHFH